MVPAVGQGGDGVHKTSPLMAAEGVQSICSAMEADSNSIGGEGLVDTAADKSRDQNLKPIANASTNSISVMLSPTTQTGETNDLTSLNKDVGSPISRSSTRVMSPSLSMFSLLSERKAPVSVNGEKKVKQRIEAVADTTAAGRLSELKRFTLWETKTNFYLVAYNTSQTRFRILKIGRTPEINTKSDAEGAVSKAAEKQGDDHSASLATGEAMSTKKPATTKANRDPVEIKETESMRWDLHVTSDRVVYTQSQMSGLLEMISEGNKTTGGLKEVGKFFGIVGFIRFTSTYYMVLISRRSVVGLLGGHYIYHCDETKILPVCHSSVLSGLIGRTKALDQEEARLLNIFKQVDLSKNFYFSYTYDLTKTLQDNLTSDDSKRTKESTAWGYNEKFIWNHHLLLPAFASSRDSWKKGEEAEAASEWVLPLVYGFVDQAKLCVLNSTIHVTLIARRSRHFAGARFLKRGTDENGHVANDVETEQIVSDALTTPFFAPKARRTRTVGGSILEEDSNTILGANPRYTSYVMHRGSIPIYWTQDSTNMSPRPPIEISVVDPYYASAALHFDDMLRRYGYPLIVLNLIKSKEKQPREVKLLGAFGECIGYLNQFLPSDRKIKYIAWDMSRASKSRDQDVIGVLEDIAEETVTTTRFFHTGPEPSTFAYRGEERNRRETILLQSGVARVNCVDCLDRTNAAQFVIGKAAFGHQLHALGLLDDPALPFDSAAVDMLTEMYHDLGDTIALQYGGSHLVNTMETYRKINQWTSHSRDMLEGLKRYYANSFIDADKQAAINLFLGVDQEVLEGSSTNANKSRRHYQQWFTPEYLEPRDNVLRSEARLDEIVTSKSSFWAEYYRPSLFTDLLRHHAFKMTAVHQHMTSTFGLPLQSSPSIQESLYRARKESNNSTFIPASPSTMNRKELETPITTSPFTSRVTNNLSSHLADNPRSPRRSVGASSSSSPKVPPKAIIGGVRRWISLNRGDQVPSRATSSSAATAKKTLQKSSNEHEEERNETSTTTNESAWPTWEEITGAPVTAPNTESLLSSLCDPNVSAEEAKEYAWWLDQFRDVAFDGGLPTSIPEPAALTPNPAAGGGVMAPLYQIGNRRPVTQKQRQQIAQGDANMYDYQVGLSQGQSFALESLIRGEEEDGSIDPAFYNYPLSANTLNSVPTEKKIKAFSHWISGHNRTNTLVPLSA